MGTERHPVTLVVSQTGKPDRIIAIGETLAIGRADDSGLVLDDKSASRRHAEIRLGVEGRYTLLDMGSANGTWLNARRVAGPTELADGDVIFIGRLRLTFRSPVHRRAAAGPDGAAVTAPSAASKGTEISWRNEVAVVLVADIRGYTRMSEVLPAGEFSRLIADWFRECGAVIEGHGGTVDKFIGDSVMSYWIARDRDRPAVEVDGALRAAADLLRLAGAFEERLTGRFPGHLFRIGIGINVGEAVSGNIGGAGHPSFTLVGDSVNVAFRLESLSKEKGRPVIVGRSVVEHASPAFEFTDLGATEIKGRKEPVSIWALKV